MSILTPLDQLKMMVDADHEPQLSNEELHTLLQQRQLEAQFSTWQSARAYAVGARVIPNPRNGLVYRCSVAGTSGTTQPAFAEDATLSDGTVTWVVASETDTAYNLRSAAAAGWLIKAGRVANRYDLADDTSKTSRSQLHDHCMLMYKTYKTKYSSIPVESESVRFQ